MPTVDEFVADVDSYIAANKQIVGVTTPQKWSEGRAIGEGELVLKFPIEINGEQHDSRTLIISAYPEADELKFHIILIYRWTVFRLDYGIGETHANINKPYGIDIPDSITGPHYHPWHENRKTITNISTPFKLPIALPLNIHIRQFDHALRWFCHEANIDLRNHVIDLPVKQRLL